MLTIVHSLIKFAQLQDVFICDFIIAIFFCKTNLFKMYCDQSPGFHGDTIKHFNGLVECDGDTNSMKWIVNLTTKIDHLAFELKSQYIGQGTKTMPLFKFFLLFELFMPRKCQS
jgi:hypothetical protein